MTYVIGFNGPPHCGKDTIANTLQTAIDSLHEISNVRVSLSLPMRLAGFAMLGMYYSDENYEQVKDVPQELFRQKFNPALTTQVPEPPTLRRWMINFSERFIKPYYGQDFWARQLKQRCPMLNGNAPGLIIVSDIGFQAEVDWFAKNAEDFMLVQLTREGTDWSKDSRGYVEAKGPMVTVANDGTPEEAAGHVISAMIRSGWSL